jgi:hypothetical protein
MDRVQGNWQAPVLTSIVIATALLILAGVALVLISMSSVPTPPPVVLHTGSLDLLAGATSWSYVANNSSMTTLSDKPAYLYFYGVDPKTTTKPGNGSLEGLNKNWKITVFFLNPKIGEPPIPQLLICTTPNCDTAGDLATNTIYVMGNNDPTGTKGKVQREDLDRTYQRLRYDVNSTELSPSEFEAYTTRPFLYQEPRANHIDKLNVVSGSKNVTYHCVDSACELEIRTRWLLRIQF